MTSFQGGNKHTHTHTQAVPHTQTAALRLLTSYLHTLNTLPRRLHARTHTHTLQRYGACFDNRQVDLALVRPERSKKSKADPREGWGFCVCGVSHFITRGTRNRPRKTFEAMGGVCGNRLCGYLWCQLQYSDCRLFPGLGLCLSAARGNCPRIVCQRADELITASPPDNLQIRKKSIFAIVILRQLSYSIYLQSQSQNWSFKCKWWVKMHGKKNNHHLVSLFCLEIIIWYVHTFIILRVSSKTWYISGACNDGLPVETGTYNFFIFKYIVYITGLGG